MDQDSRLSRRGFFGRAAAGTAAATLPATPALARSRRRADVVVVGAGLAGLTAARALVRHHRSVIVLEARDRVGGRTFNYPLGDGQVVELGGEFVGPTQDRLTVLAKEVGVTTFKTYNEGDNVAILGGERSTYPSVPGLPNPPDDTNVRNDALALLGAIDPLAREVGVKAPWKAKDAAKLDHETLAQYVKGLAKSPLSPPLLDAASEAIWGKDTAQLSLLFSLFYSAAAGDAKNPGSFARLISTGGGAQESRFVGGSQQIALRVAKALAGRIVLDTPVRRIAQSRNGVDVVADGVSVSAKLVIVAVPPVVAHAIRYEPALPAARAKLLARYTPGTMIKAHLVYKTPWWRDKGLTGQIVVDAGPAGATFDNTPPSGQPGVILGFIGGRHSIAHRMRSLAQRKQVFVDELAAALGDEARNPIDWFEFDWSGEEWTKGCPTGSLPPGVLSRFGVTLRPPTGRIHWAGTETSDFWAGYMDGAVRSGERAAREVLAAL